MATPMHRHGPVLLIRVDGKSVTDFHDPKAISLEHRELGDGGKEAKITLADVGMELLDNPSFQEGRLVEWRFGYRNALSPLYQAKIFVTEPNFDAYSGITLTLYAYDAVAQAGFVRRTTVWRNDEASITHSEVAQMLAEENGWKTEIEPTKNKVTEIPQANMSDWEFIHDVLAPAAVAADPELEGLNYRVWFDSFSETLYFQPVRLDVPPKQVYRFMTENEDPVLISFRPKVKTNRPDGAGEATTTAADVNGDGVVVNEDGTQEDVAGTGRFTANFDTNKTYNLIQSPDQADPANTDGSDSAAGQATTAQSKEMLDHLEADISLIGDPTLRANDIISVWNVGQKFSGNYLVHELTHRIGDGFVTDILGKKDALPVGTAGDGDETGRSNDEDGSPDSASSQQVQYDTNKGYRIVDTGGGE